MRANFVLYDKPPLTFDEQLERIDGRGLHVGDREQARVSLETIGYYRLSGYWYGWRRAATDSERKVYREDEFMPGHAFEDAVALYSFDRRLRLYLLDALERIEIALRVGIAYVAGVAGPLAYLDRMNLGSNADKYRTGAELSNLEEFIKRNGELLSRSKEVFAEHIKAKYESVAPIWIATELWDFGQLSNYYAIMKSEDQSQVARALGIPRKELLENWIQCLNYVRNLCAHHSRLYRRILVIKPSQKKMSHIDDLAHIRSIDPDLASRLYPVLCLIIFMMQSVAQGSIWPHALRRHVANFPVGVDAALEHYGFPSDWHKQNIWA